MREFQFFESIIEKGILRLASLTCVFYLRHSSNWNPHRLHSEPFPPKEKHNVGLLRFDDDHDHICYRFAQVRIFGGKSNIITSLQYFSKNRFLDGLDISLCYKRLYVTVCYKKYLELDWLNFKIIYQGHLVEEASFE
jgi:hypothetical protein